MITLDDSAGRPVLFASRLDGRNRVRLWDMPDSWPGTMVDDNTVVLAAVWEERDVERLEVFSSDGVFQRALTEPASDESDTSPSVAVTLCTSSATLGETTRVAGAWSAVD